MSDHTLERDLLILYATETGNAQEVADRVARQCRRLHFKSRVVNIESYSLVGVLFSIWMLKQIKLAM
jgi:flavodoxin